MNEINTRELGLFELFSIGWNIFKNNIRAMLQIALLIGIPVSVILSLASGIITRMLGGTDITALIDNEDLWAEFITSGMFANISAVNILAILVQAVFLPLVTMAVADVSRDFLNGTAVNAGRSILNSFSKGTVFVIAAIINMVLTFVGTMFFIIPGLIVTVWLYFFDYAIIYDDAGSIESLKQSKKLVKGQFFKIAVYILFINLVSSILSNIVYYIFGGISMFFAGEVLVRTLTIFTQTFLACVVSVFYLNRKALYIKNENKNNMYF